MDGTPKGMDGTHGTPWGYTWDNIGDGWDTIENGWDTIENGWDTMGGQMGRDRGTDGTP